MIQNKKDIIKVFLSSGFFFGFSPFASGTFGTIPALIIYLVFIKFIKLNLFITLTLFLIFFLLALSLANWSMRYWGTKDPKKFVLDEICAYMLIPVFFYNTFSFKFALYAFFIFRFFDIFKPPIASHFDKKEGGIYIVLDDIVSALYTIVTIYVLRALHIFF